MNFLFWRTLKEKLAPIHLGAFFYYICDVCSKIKVLCGSATHNNNTNRYEAKEITSFN